MKNGVIFLAALAVPVIIIGLLAKNEPEKFYIPRLLLYYFISSVQMGNFPMGFMACFVFILSRPTIKNRIPRWTAMSLGLLYFIIYILNPSWHVMYTI